MSNESGAKTSGHRFYSPKGSRLDSQSTSLPYEAARAGIKEADHEEAAKTGRWRIISTRGRLRKFSATLLKTFNLGKRRIAIVSVPKAL